jgi:hypothetical protein
MEGAATKMTAVVKRKRDSTYHRKKDDDDSRNMVVSAVSIFFPFFTAFCCVLDRLLGADDGFGILKNQT